MKLQEVFDQLTSGELSQLVIGGTESGVISPTKYPAMVNHVNLALRTLYRRFNLKEGRVKIGLIAGRYDYPMVRKFAVSTGAGASKFIQDSQAAPFLEDILKINRVLASSGFEFALNIIDDPFSINTPTVNSLRVPKDIVEPPTELIEDMRTTTLEVVYRAAHPILSNEDVDPEVLDIELPYSHMEPLLYFVASRIHTPAGISNEANMGNIYYAKYEGACQELEAKGIQIDQGSMGTKLEAKGFV